MGHGSEDKGKKEKAGRSLIKRAAKGGTSTVREKKVGV